MNTYETGQHDTRPWGEWRVLDAGPNHAVKRIRVAPGAQLSLQYHLGRSETWVVVAGIATVTLDGARFRKGAGEAVSIPLQAVHRVANEEAIDLEFIEVQYGERLDEDDIVRLTDDYGRS